MDVSKASAKPLALYKPLATAPATPFVVLTTAPLLPFLMVPEFNVPRTPASFASGHPSPSESKSKWFGMPSASGSLAQFNLGLALGLLEDAKLNVALATPP